MNTRNLLERRAATAAEMRGLISTNDGNLDAEQQQRFDALKGELDGLESRIARQSVLEDAERRIAGQPIAGTGDRQLDAEMRNFSLVRAIASQAGINVDAGRERELSAEVARRSGRSFQGMAVPMSVFETRVLTTALPAGGPGSNLIATDLDGNQMIDRLRNAMVVRRMGARVLSNLTSNLDIPRLKASATAGWVAENSPLSLSDLQFDKVSLTPKHCGAITELSRNMLQQASPDVEALVRADFAAILAEALDRAAISGTGTSNQPRGILSTTGIGSVAMGTNGAALSLAAAADLMGRVADANVPEETLGFVSNTKVKAYLSKIVDTTGRPLGEDVVFQGYPARYSNTVPANLTKGTGTNLSALIFGNWSDLLIGTWSEFDLLVNPYESTAYLKGNVQVRGMMTVDIAVRHPESFAAITDIVA